MTLADACTQTNTWSSVVGLLIMVTFVGFLAWLFLR